MIETPRPVHTHDRSSLYIYIKGFSTLTSDYEGHKDVAPALYMLQGPNHHCSCLGVTKNMELTF